MRDTIARLERELAEARREAESATRTRSAFLAAMSHELKTPMNAVFGSARLLLETALTPQQHEHVATTLAAGEAMLTIIEDAIDYAALEGGALALAHAPFDLAAVIEAAVQIDAGRAHEKGLDLAAVIDPALPALVVGDAVRVRLIVRKLLSNAITFTDTGSVLVRAAVAAGGGVRIEFEDTGVGVRTAGTPDLFEAFVQADTSTTRRHGGMGLGLAIGRRLAEAMGGRIGVDDLDGAGSRFWVELPLLSGDAAPAPAAAPAVPAFDGRRAVVLCASRATRLAADAELRAAGFEVAVADTAAVGLDHLAATGGTDLLVLDVRVPDLDMLGMRLAGAALNTVPRAVLVLAPTTERQALPAMFATGATWLPGPLLRRPLRETLERVFRADGEREPFDPIEALGSLRILAADDYPANLRIVARVLEKRGHTVETVTTGAAAAAAVLASHYDLVLMDCRMPEMDGYDATALIRAREGGRRRTPIIALTANDSDDDRQRCVDVGMDAFVAKPLRPAELFAAIELVLAAAGVRPGAAGLIAAAPGGGSRRSGDLLQDLRDALASLTRHAEASLSHVDDAGAGNVRAVLQAAALAADLADRLGDAPGPASPEAASMPVAS
jgi:two-component system sensor histidine kinase/response regulator